MVVSRAAEKLQSARIYKRRAATTVSYLRVGSVLQYYSWIMQHLSIDLYGVV